MFYSLIWFVVVALLALWSVAAWAMNGVAVWTVSNAGALSGAASGSSPLRLPDWLAPWVPQEITLWAQQMLAALGPLVDGLLQAAPALAGGLTVAAWVIWGIGSALLLMVGAGAHLLVALWRRANGSRPGSRTSLAADRPG